MDISKSLFVGLFVFLFPVVIFAQHNTNIQAQEHHTQKSEKQLPSWAPVVKYDASAHVYFPDYYTFYDPKRNGYAYWDNGGYKFSPTIPLFLEKVDMSKTRIQILKGLSLDLYPEQNYPYYMKMYPAGPANNKVPVPR